MEKGNLLFKLFVSRRKIDAVKEMGEAIEHQDHDMSVLLANIAQLKASKSIKFTNYDKEKLNRIYASLENAQKEIREGQAIANSMQSVAEEDYTDNLLSV